MKVVLLAGGLGTRLSEETDNKPKPLVEVGGHPLLWHIMKYYRVFGFREFLVALGYKGEMVKKYFADYLKYHRDLSIDLAGGEVVASSRAAEDWRIELVGTGLNTYTGGRIKRLEPMLSGQRFMVTYGDGVSDIDLEKLLEHHLEAGKIGTVTAVRPPARFGGIVFEGNLVSEFTEKSQIGEGWINGGFMVFEPEVFDYIRGDETSLEAHVLENLSGEGQLSAYRHHGFWQCVDTLRDLKLLNSMWDQGSPPWRAW